MNSYILMMLLEWLYAGFCNYEPHIFVPFSSCSSFVLYTQGLLSFSVSLQKIILHIVILPYILISSFFYRSHSSFKDFAWIFNATYKAQSTKFCLNAWEIFLNYINIHNLLLSPEIKPKLTIFLCKLCSKCDDYKP